MVTIRKKKIGNTEYYYLVHSIKIGKKVGKKEKYLGKKLPKNIDEIKRKFLYDIYKEKWYKKLEHIKKNFLKEYKEMPFSAKEKYLEHFMIKFTYNTNRIEGGTLNLKETAALLERGITPANKPVKDIKEAEAHRDVFYKMLEYKKDLSLRTILYWHRLLFKETKQDIAGKIRTHPVGITGSEVELPIPVELNALLNDFFRWYNKFKDKLQVVELAALAHLKFVSIHPFSDGNGRISRIIMNFILNKNKYPMLSISYINRNSYYTALERAQIKKQEYVFVQNIIRRYLKEYKRYLKK